MIITCPYCGPRDVSEFSYQGDANRTRPDPASTDQDAWNAYVYDRVNTAGDHREFWQHSGGCRSHLAVVRNTITHAVLDVRLARDTAAGPSPAGPEPSEAPAAQTAAKAPRRRRSAA